MNSILIYINQNFDYQIYLIFTKIQGFLWSIADIILIFYILRIIQLSKKTLNKKPPLIRYGLIILSTLLVPLLFYTKTSREFLHLESVICGIQFIILIYTTVKDREDFLKYLTLNGILKINKNL